MRGVERGGECAMSGKASVYFVLPAGTEGGPAAQETLRGIASQTYPASLIELIQVQYVPGEPGAHTSALNAAREGATGDCVVPVEPGVVWDATKLERQVLRLGEDSSAGACVHRMTARESSGVSHSLDLAEVHSYGARIGCLLSAPWGPGAAMLKRDVASGVGAYRNVDEALWEYAVRMVEKGYPLDLLDEDLAVWNMDAGSQGRVPEPRRPLICKEIRHRFLKPYHDRATAQTLFPEAGIGSEPAGRLVLAGLYQKNDDLGSSHTLCQEAGAKTDLLEASYWHGIVHRREPDFPNARHWFRKVEGSPLLAEIERDVIDYLQRVLQVPDYGRARETAFQLLRHLHDRGTWDPVYVVDLCEACVEEGCREKLRLLEEIQETEFDAVFRWTYRMATGG